MGQPASGSGCHLVGGGEHHFVSSLPRFLHHLKGKSVQRDRVGSRLIRKISERHHVTPDVGQPAYPDDLPVNLASEGKSGVPDPLRLAVKARGEPGHVLVGSGADLQSARQFAKKTALAAAWEQTRGSGCSERDRRFSKDSDLGAKLGW
jgi:hypothetical protein